jgi:hypothetical protein
LSSASSAQIDVVLNSVFASRKRNLVEEEKSAQTPTMVQSNFQVYAKIEEETRKDNRLTVSFLLTLNDTKNSVIYEFRGNCNIFGTGADFEAIMEARKDSRIPKILDILYQRVYPVVFMLAGMTASSYPQSIALLTEMVSNEPIQVQQEALPAPEKPAAAQKAVEPKPMPEQGVEAPKPAMAKVKKPQPSMGDADSAKAAAAK